MRLLSDIIDIATGDAPGLPTLLRKCLVLSYALKNEKLKEWADKELNGYEKDDELPDYRQVKVISKGTFFGSFGRVLYDQPLHTSVLQKEHRHLADTAQLTEPVAGYEVLLQNKSAGGSFRSEWSPDLTAYYQQKFVKDKDWALNRAWREIPEAALVSSVDTVRNRVLRFALDLRDELGLVGDDLDALPPEKVDQSVITNIYGGNNVIARAAHGITQIGTVNVQHGDLDGLIARLKEIGFEDTDIPELQQALAKDAAETGGTARHLGERTIAWVKGTAAKLGHAGTGIAIDTAKAEATKWIMQYLGLL